ncbi:hypothetical protein AG1IA_07546 [Rhizoctonia solani AG-1 IA]|uniref:Uncharacterized protein n=1 Tax=Thanatephorus cucumeris (strain AG1-IA) TaxID=983506 RepID=L8WQ12_THACA|nr:hypothetical protein AG1IA_07546 [Rhizoctonia solani AG-1 IA]
MTLIGERMYSIDVIKLSTLALGDDCAMILKVTGRALAEQPRGYGCCSRVCWLSFSAIGLTSGPWVTLQPLSRSRMKPIKIGFTTDFLDQLWTDYLSARTLEWTPDPTGLTRSDCDGCVGDDPLVDRGCATCALFYAYECVCASQAWVCRACSTNKLSSATSRVYSNTTLTIDLHLHKTTRILKSVTMPFFSKSRSSVVSDASSMSSGSSASLLVVQDKKSSSGKDYSAAFGALSSKYGVSGSAAPAFNVSLPKGSNPQSQSAPSSSSNVKKVRAKEFGAISNKYGAIAINIKVTMSRGGKRVHTGTYGVRHDSACEEKADLCAITPASELGSTTKELPPSNYVERGTPSG